MFPLLSLLLEFFHSLLPTQFAISFFRHISLFIQRTTAFIRSVSKLLLFAIVCYITGIMDCMYTPAFASSAAAALAAAAA
jgi:hypothetical protein